MKLKPICIAALFATGLLANAAYASPMWTVVTTGTITSGYDAEGIFGNANQTLTGLTYSLTVVTSSDANGYQYVVSSTPWWHAVWDYSAGSFTTTVTVAGKTVNFGPATSWAQFRSVADGLSTGQGNFDRIGAYSQGSVGPGAFINVSSNVTAYNPKDAFVPSLDIGQTISYAPRSSVITDAYFRLGGAMDPSAVTFSGSIDLLMVNVEDGPSQVPEPSSVALIGLAAAGFALARRRDVRAARFNLTLQLNAST